MMKLFLLLALVATVAYGQIPSSGSCPTNIPSKLSFDWSRFKGKWYGLSNTRSYQDLTGKCITHTYKDLPLGNATLTNFNYNITGTANITEIGKISIPDPTKGEYTVAFPSAPWGQSLKVQIVDTDYTSCAVAYGCYQVPLMNQKLEFVWFKARNRINLFGLPNCDAALAATKVATALILPVDLINCPWDL